jgi:hypothetical protein
MPADLPPCPAGGCICTWNWIHTANNYNAAGRTEGYGSEFYLSTCEAAFAVPLLIHAHRLTPSNLPRRSASPQTSATSSTRPASRLWPRQPFRASASPTPRAAGRAPSSRSTLPRSRATTCLPTSKSRRSTTLCTGLPTARRTTSSAPTTLPGKPAVRCPRKLARRELSPAAARLSPSARVRRSLLGCCSAHEKGCDRLFFLPRPQSAKGPAPQPAAPYLRPCSFSCSHTVMPPRTLPSRLIQPSSLVHRRSSTPHRPLISLVPLARTSPLSPAPLPSPSIAPSSRLLL